MEKKIKSLQACVVILTIALCACVYKISVLGSRVSRLDFLVENQYDRIMSDVNAIYQNVDEKLREEASLLSSVEAEQYIKELADDVCAPVSEDGIYHYCLQHGLI